MHPPYQNVHTPSPANHNALARTPTIGRKWSIPPPVQRAQSVQQQTPAFNENAILPMQQIENVIGEDFTQFISPDFAEVFTSSTTFSKTCINAARNIEHAEYNRRHAMAEAIAYNAGLTTENIARAKTFLQLLADIWVVDQAFYHKNPRKQNAYCPLCQPGFFGTLQDHADMSTDSKGIASTPQARRPWNKNSYIQHVRQKQQHCFGHNILARFFREIHRTQI